VGKQIKLRNFRGGIGKVGSSEENENTNGILFFITYE